MVMRISAVKGRNVALIKFAPGKINYFWIKGRKICISVIKSKNSSWSCLKRKEKSIDSETDFAVQFDAVHYTVHGTYTSTALFSPLNI